MRELANLIEVELVLMSETWMDLVVADNILEYGYDLSTYEYQVRMVVKIRV